MNKLNTGQFIIWFNNAQHRLLCNPGVVSEYPACLYACAAVNWFENKVNQFTAARTPCETRAAQSRPRCAWLYSGSLFCKGLIQFSWILL
jgi:hypothetical protein